METQFLNHASNLVNTNTIEQIKAINKIDAENIAKSLLSEYGLWFLVALIIVLAKNIVINFAKGILIFYGSHFNNDDIIYISGRQARIVRVGLTNTTFYMTDRKTKMVVPNEQLKELIIEKTLPLNGGSPYLPKGNDPEFDKNKTTEKPKNN